jgi:hypothetical protein
MGEGEAGIEQCLLLVFYDPWIEHGKSIHLAILISLRISADNSADVLAIRAMLSHPSIKNTALCITIYTHK